MSSTVRLRPPARRPERSRPTDRGRISARRLRLALGALLAVAALLAGRLIDVQGIQGARYAALARLQQLRVIPLPAQRGELLDRFGAVLAESVDARDVYADPEQIQAAAHPVAGGGPAMTPTQIATQLAPLVGIPVANLLGIFAEHEQFVYLVHGLSPAVGDRIAAENLPGIGVLDSTRRVYPQGALAAPVIGFVGASGSGLAGIEYSENQLLAGTPGRWVVETGADGRVIPDGRNIEQPARAGTSVELTIDSDIQWEAEQVLAAQVKATRAHSGSVIVLNPHTGQILALASAPSFNPNDPFVSPATDWTDVAATDTYEPGSVEKAVTMTAALAAGLVTPYTPFTIPPTISVGGSVFHDAETHGTERLTVTGIVAESSNIGAIEVAERVGGAALFHYMLAYGYGEPTGSGLVGEATGYVPPPATWSATTLPTLAFGQGLSVTALQVAEVYATIANGGVRVTPSIIKGFLSPSGTYTPAPPPARRRVVTPAVAHELTEILQDVTEPLATAPAAAIPGYDVAGKTGTANRADGHGGYSGYTASFIGFAPATDPALEVEVVLDRPQTSIYGGTVAAPVFHQVMSFALQALHVPPVAGSPQRVPILAP